MFLFLSFRIDLSVQQEERYYTVFIIEIYAFVSNSRYVATINCEDVTQDGRISIATRCIIFSVFHGIL